MDRNTLLGAASLMLAIAIQSPANAESFSVTGTDVVTHRHGFEIFQVGTTNLDKPTKMTCTSDKGCSLIIQTQVGTGYPVTVCTAVDGVDAAPPCYQVQSSVGVITFQGAPALSKGVHTVQTRLTRPEPPIGYLTGFQIVYTLYQH
jgi:hypothetical protein